MAKYCMFCGEEIPNNAQFCPSCGQKQNQTSAKPSPTSSKNNYNLEDEDDEMDLLLKYGMMVSTPKVKQEPQKIITLDYKPDVEEPVVEQPIIEEPIIEEPIKEEPVLLIENIETKSYLEESLFGDIKKDSNKVSEDIKTEIEVKEEPIIEESIPEIIEEPLIPETVEESINITKPIETEQIIEEPIKKTTIPDTTIISQSKEEVLFSWDDDDFASVEESTEDHIREALNKEEPETEKKEDAPLNRHAAKRRDMSIRRRSVSVEEDEETFSTSLDTSGKNSMLEAATMLADEKADYEKRKKVKIEDEDIDAKLDDRSDLEGRKQQTQKVEKRRKSQRTYDESKHYKIEQDKSDMDENEDPEYDGYYENVLPIDHDQERKKTFDVKVLLVILLLIVGCVGLIYFLLGTM